MSFYVFVRPIVIKQAEKSKRWPRDCIVCLRERKVTVTSQNLEEALQHRRQEHSWLADGLTKRRKR